MAEQDPSENPFAGVPFLADIMKAMSSQGSMHWDLAKQFALMGATEDGSDQNVEPSSRIGIESLLPIATMHVAEVSGRDLEPIRIECVTRAQWAHHTLDAYKPLFDELASSMSHPTSSQDEASDPMAAMMAGLSRMMAPSMLGMAIGSMIGHLSQRAFGQYDLPLPRPSRSLMIVPSTIDSFADEWSLSREDARIWTLIHELTVHSFFAVDHTRDAIWSAVHNHVRGFRVDPSQAMNRVTDIEIDGDLNGDPMALIQKAFSDPELLLGTTTSPAQQANRPNLDALISLVIGYTDHIVDTCADRLLGPSSPIGEALRRRRLESNQVDIYVEHLLGLRLQRSHVERGRNFVDGVVERSGTDGLNKLFESADNLPTLAELDAPGLWLARLEIQN